MYNAIKDGKISTLAHVSIIADGIAVKRPGGLIVLLQTIAQTGANVVSVTHARQAKNCGVGACAVSMGLETHNHQHIDRIMQALQDAGYDAQLK